MKMKPGTPLSVRLDFGDRDVAVGRLALDSGVAIFERSDELVAANLHITPFFSSEQLVRAENPRVFDGLHGIFADSLPDAWGTLLVRRRTERNGIPYSSLRVLDRLAIVGKHGMGALTYHPEIIDQQKGETIDLDALARESGAMLLGASSDLAPQLEALGGSSGGARPKVLVGMNASGDLAAGARELPTGFAPWLIKFRGPRDFLDIGPLEMAYATMAGKAGVEMSETTLISARNGPGYFATRRFDRADNTRRLHVASAAGLLEIDWAMPSIDYDTLLKLTMHVTRNHQDVERVFRRMIFNIVAHNRDDHAKQHAYLLDSKGHWRVAPSYDVTFAQGPGNEHYLAVAGKGTNISRKDIRNLGVAHHIAVKQTDAIIDQTLDATSHFRQVAKDFGVSAATITAVATVLERMGMEK